MVEQLLEAESEFGHSLPGEGRGKQALGEGRASPGPFSASAPSIVYRGIADRLGRRLEVGGFIFNETFADAGV